VGLGTARLDDWRVSAIGPAWLANGTERPVAAGDAVLFEVGVLAAFRPNAALPLGLLPSLPTPFGGGPVPTRVDAS
jgi:hypothetical protein